MRFFAKAKEKFGALIGRDIQYLVADSVKNTDFEIVELAGKRIMTIKRARNPVQTIIYPAVCAKDIWKTSALTTLINKIDKMYETGWLDICPIRDSLHTFSLKTTPSTVAALNQLHNIHCVVFSNLHPEVFEAIPRLLTHIFTEGRISIDAVVVDGICHTVTEPEAIPA